ncbi:unnamed protein product [Pieris macdunnoughi]|uniref:Uncharacterized protein n=1 Tax=Pieris macdunnoughi TaxID=345717 RepID=A0A821YFR5_9NEOP|nr:unnamed protein product [Pieris macdunnoughi]
MGVIKVTPDTAALISACDLLDDMKVSPESCDKSPPNAGNYVGRPPRHGIASNSEMRFDAVTTRDAKKTFFGIIFQVKRIKFVQVACFN